MLVIEFGSNKRGDFNMSSDKDMLLIGGDLSKLFKEKERRKIEGYSVTCMTRNKAKYMVNQGGLFFKHIIDEGFLVEGSQEKYLDIIRGWNAAPNYQKDIDGNVELLEILSHVPKTSEGLLVAADIVTISIRNILIRKLASLGLYVFSWEGVATAALDFNFITFNEKIILLHARQIKNYYRQGSDIQVSIFFLERLLMIISKILCKKIDFSFGKKQEIIQLHEKCNDGSYKQLRSLELLCAFYGFDSSPQKILNWIRDPNYFCATKGPNQSINQTARSAVAFCYV